MGVLVVDVQGRNDPFVDYACAASAVSHSRSVQPAAKDQLHLFRSAQIDILANDFLKETAPAHCPVPDLSERKLPLQYG